MAALPLLHLLDTATASRRPGAGWGIAVVEVSMSSGQLTPLHEHEQDEAVAVVAGTVTLHVDDDEVVLSAGDSHVIPAGAVHTIRAEQAGVRYLSAALARSLGRYEEFVRAVSLPGDLGSSAAGLHAIASVNGTVVRGGPGELPRRVSAPAA